jgi:hypothetical protein
MNQQDNQPQPSLPTSLAEEAVRGLKKYWLIVTTVMILVFVSWQGKIDDYSQTYINDSLQGAVVAYAGARTLNAGISVLQSTDVGIGFASITVGQSLDPINDLIEDFSSLLKWAIGSLLIQKILLNLISDLGFNLLLSCAGLWLIVDLIWPSRFSTQVRKFVLSVLVLRFALVAAVLCNSLVDQLYLESELTHNMSAISELSVFVNNKPEEYTLVKDTDGNDPNSAALNDVAPAPSSNAVFNQIGKWVKNTTDIVEKTVVGTAEGMANRFNGVVTTLDISVLKEKTDAVIQNILQSMAIFAFKCILMPLLFVLAILKSTKYVLK